MIDRDLLRQVLDYEAGELIDQPDADTWATVVEAARAYVNAVEFDAPHTVDVPGHYLIIKVRSK